MAHRPHGEPESVAVRGLSRTEEARGDWLQALADHQLPLGSRGLRGSRKFQINLRRLPGPTVLESGRGWRLSVALLPFMADLLLLSLALVLGGLALLLSLVTSVRGRGGPDPLGLAAVAVVGPLLVLAGGERVAHPRPCYLYP